MDHSNPNRIYSKNTIITMNTNDKHDTNWIQFATEPHATNTIFVEYYKLYPTWDTTTRRIYVALPWTCVITDAIRRKYNII